MMKKGYEIAFSKNKKTLVSRFFETREQAEKLLPLYQKKGWKGGIRNCEYEIKEMTVEEKEELKRASRFLEYVTGRALNDLSK